MERTGGIPGGKGGRGLDCVKRCVANSMTNMSQPSLLYYSQSYLMSGREKFNVCHAYVPNIFSSSSPTEISLSSVGLNESICVP